MRFDLSLTQDLCARLCHDLGGPLGSVSGALDLIGPVDEAALVARESAEVLEGRLQLWRALAGAGTGPLDREGLAALLAGGFGGSRVSADLSGMEDGELPATMARAALAAAMLGGEALPRGGVVHLSGGTGALLVVPEGRNAHWPPGLALALALAGETVSGPREVLAPLLVSLAETADCRLDMVPSGTDGIDGLSLLPL